MPRGIPERHYERGAMADRKKTKTARQGTGPELREDLMLDSLMRIGNTLMILSGKGGVGKSTVP